jgi:exodeoxyribonuclease VII small subunit
MGRMSESPEPGPSFEAALVELQQIVDELESGSLGLEASLSRFEQGIRMVKACHQLLDRAEQRIEILTGFDAAGNPVTRTVSMEATVEVETTPAPAGSDRARPRKRARPADPPLPNDSSETGTLFS